MEPNLIPMAGPKLRPARSPRLRYYWISAAIIPVVAGGMLWWFLQRSATVPPLSMDTQRGAHIAQVSVQTVALTQSSRSLEVTGTVQAELEASLSAKVMGRVQSVFVRAGERVRHGQALITLDASDLAASVSQADAGLRAARVSYDTARVAARMEDSLSTAHIAEAQAKVAQSKAAQQTAMAKLELIQAGPRRQEREQASLAVTQAKSSLTLAENNLKRASALYEDGAIAAQQYDQVRSLFEVAKSQYETAQQGKSLTDEGSRAEEIREAQQVVLQANAAVQEADAGLKSAEASALQTQVRKQEIRGAQAQIGQSQANLELAQTTRTYATIAAPFDGIVTKRLADPGVMASPGVLLLTVQGGRLRLEAVVPESALGSVKVGAAVPVHFDAPQKRDLTGRVVEIAPQGDANSHTFVVKIDLPSGSGASAGMFGRARFTIGTESRLLVPAPAVWEREGLHYLYVVDEDRLARLRMITVGDPIGAQIPVLSGLNVGERIVTEGRERITDGTPIAEKAR